MDGVPGVGLELERLGAKIGLHLAPARRPDRSLPIKEAHKRWQDSLEGLEAYHRELLAAASKDAKPRWPVAALELRAYLDASEPILETIQDLLLGSIPPVWESDLSMGYEAPIPNLLGILKLQRLLLFEAGERARLGETEASLRSLEASWRLRKATQEYPSLLSFLIAASTLRNQQLILRRLCSVPEVWQKRLAELDLQGSAFLMFQMESWKAYETSRGTWPIEGKYVGRFGGVFLRDFARRFQKIVEALKAQDPGTLDTEAFLNERVAKLPDWQFLARMLIPNYRAAWQVALSGEISAELTALVLAERQRRLEEGDCPPNTRRPARIEGLNWLYEESEEGVTIRLDQDLPSPAAKALPTHFLLGPSNSLCC